VGGSSSPTAPAAVVPVNFVLDARARSSCDRYRQHAGGGAAGSVVAFEVDDFDDTAQRLDRHGDRPGPPRVDRLSRRLLELPLRPYAGAARRRCSSCPSNW
jgi:hypothetical protein